MNLNIAIFIYMSLDICIFLRSLRSVLKGTAPSGPLYFFNGEINRVYTFSGTFRPTEHDYEKMGSLLDSTENISKRQILSLILKSIFLDEHLLRTDKMSFKWA